LNSYKPNFIHISNLSAATPKARIEMNQADDFVEFKKIIIIAHECI